MKKSSVPGFTVQSIQGNLYVCPNRDLKKAVEPGGYAAKIRGRSGLVFIYPEEGPESFSLKSSYSSRLSAFLEEAGYEIKRGCFLVCEKKGSGWLILRDGEKEEGIPPDKPKPKPEPKRFKSVEVVSLDEPAVEVKIVKEYPLPNLFEGGPSNWSHACLLIARGVPKIDIEMQAGLSVSSCMVLERSCPVFIQTLKDFDKACNRDRSNGLVKAVMESWQRQLDRRKSA